MLVIAVLVGGTMFGATSAWSAAGDSASGGGQVTYGAEKRTFAFTARENAAGDVKGQMQLINRAQGVKIHAELDCLRLSGNTATAAGTVTSSNSPAWPVGARMIFTVEDNGEGANAPVDRISLVYQGNYNCQLVSAPIDREVEGGNIQVRAGN
jgi:hypothetical protein